MLSADATGKILNFDIVQFLDILRAQNTGNMSLTFDVFVIYMLINGANFYNDTRTEIDC